MIHIVNKKFYKGCCELVSRPTPLGNPYASKDSRIAKFHCDTSDEAVAAYKTYLNAEIINGNQVILDELHRLYKLSLNGDLILGCWCVPFNECHAEYIKKILENFHIIIKKFPNLFDEYDYI